jgi:hypothetical protein
MDTTALLAAMMWFLRVGILVIICALAVENAKQKNIVIA